MTHFGAMVCLPATDPGDVRAAIAAAMAPYDAETDSYEIGKGKWDRWRIEGEFLVRPAFADDPAIIREAVWPTGKARVYPPLRCDGGPVHMLDITAMRAMARETGRREWAEWSRLLARYPVARSSADLTAQHGTDGWKVYAAQPLVLAANEQPQGSPLYYAPFGSDPVKYFGYDEEVFLADCEARATSGWALVTLDGAWLDYDGFAGPARQFTRWQAAYLDELPGDAVLVRLSCHV